MKIGLYFGTYNPIHVGHLIIANYMADFTDLDQVWLVVTPQNPLKPKSTLLEDYHRLAMVRIAIEDNSRLKASNIEFDLPKPSYTVNTLAYLREKHPDYHFSLIMGEDNLRTFHKWRNHEEIIKEHHLYVYPRALTESERHEQNTMEPNHELMNHPHVHICDAPVMKLSASFIRDAIAQKHDVRYLITEPVYKYLQEMHFYKRPEIG
jgi:nicotinate-nucleotide adenylyltransferase